MSPSAQLTVEEMFTKNGGAILLAVLALFLLPFRPQAQLDSPNDLGIRMGHIHLNVTDVAAARKFWIEQGGTSVSAGSVEMVKFPGAFLMFSEARPTGDSAGSIVDHIGFLSRQGASVVERFRALGIPQKEVNAQGTGGFLFTREGLRTEIPQRDSIRAAMIFDQIHFFPPDRSAMTAMQGWYATTFGAKQGRARPDVPIPYEEQLLPGVNLRFSIAGAQRAPTKSRAIDHIGFEVGNLPAYVASLERNGVKFDVPYTRRSAAEGGVASARLTDPWGTSIELTEGLDLQ